MLWKVLVQRPDVSQMTGPIQAMRPDLCRLSSHTVLTVTKTTFPHPLPLWYGTQGIVYPRFMDEEPMPQAVEGFCSGRAEDTPWSLSSQCLSIAPPS